MCAVPLSVAPLTLPWNVTSTDAIGKLFWPENVKESLETTPEVIGTWTRPACGGVKTSVPVMASPFWFSVSSAGPCHLCPRLSVDSIDPFQTPEMSWRNTQPASKKIAKARTISASDNGLSRIFYSPVTGNLMQNIAAQTNRPALSTRSPAERNAVVSILLRKAGGSSRRLRAVRPAQ